MPSGDAQRRRGGDAHGATRCSQRHTSHTAPHRATQRHTAPHRATQSHRETHRATQSHTLVAARGDQSPQRSRHGTNATILLNTRGAVALHPKLPDAGSPYLLCLAPQPTVITTARKYPMLPRHCPPLRNTRPALPPGTTSFCSRPAIATGRGWSLLEPVVTAHREIPCPCIDTSMSSVRPPRAHRIDRRQLSGCTGSLLHGNRMPWRSARRRSRPLSATVKPNVEVARLATRLCDAATRLWRHCSTLNAEPAVGGVGVSGGGYGRTSVRGRRREYFRFMAGDCAAARRRRCDAWRWRPCYGGRPLKTGWG